MTKKQKKMLYRILIAAALFLAAKFVPLPPLLSTLLYFIAYFTVGYAILHHAWKGLCNRRVFAENFLMAVATVGAIALALYERSGDYSEAVAVMLFYQIGELFQSYAVGKSRRSLTALMDMRPDYANIARDGKLDAVIGRAEEISALSRSSTAARRTTPASSVSRASARLPSPKDLPSASWRVRCPSSSEARRSTCLT